MSAKAVPLLFCLCLAVPAFGQAPRFEFQAVYGGWTFSPFKTAIEKETERIVTRSYDRIVGSTLVGSLLPGFAPDIDLKSSGHSLSLSFWHRAGRRFAVGFRGDILSARIPLAMTADQTIDIFGAPLAEIRTAARGEVRLKSAVLSLLGRWTALAAGAVAVHLKGGVMAVPVGGTVALDLACDVRSPLGDLSLTLPLDKTIRELRDMGVDISRWIFSPLAGVDVQIEIRTSVGLVLDVTMGQGVFYSGGVFVAF